MAATLGLARIMSYSEDLAHHVKDHDLIKIFVNLLKDHNSSYEKKIGAFALRSIAKHSTELAQAVFDAKGMDGLYQCLGNDDSSVREMAASALAELAKYTAEQAQLLNNHGVTQLLVECISKEQEESLKREALVALTEIAKHDDSLSESILDKGGAISLIRMLSSSNVLIRRQVPFLSLKVHRAVHAWPRLRDTRRPRPVASAKTPLPSSWSVSRIPTCT